MPEINLLSALPKVKRNVQARLNAKDPEVVRISKQYGEMYFDGPRDYGYGGYRYDGRWVPVAKDMVDHFGLKAGDRVLDIGCAKGFLVKDFMKACPGLEAYGIDISEYALMNCEPEVVGRLHLGNADHLPFPDNSFDAVISLNTVHNLPRERVIIALREIQRVSGGKAYIQVDSYHTPEQKSLFEDWVLTAEFHDYPEGWIKVFEEAGYTGDYNWTLV
ncbi:class I SAM-dependent methyltransferase [Coxiella burnetii]|uniref:Methyltransferase n=2 Tax=Coxiella burnetii TaxID=777 RepID=Q83DM1_COXBU|nr:class I SAM-dependent methyltransferase [Coxiella burnetii]NP_819712.1 methyltransferase [Coxiella burnetii RSA 493]AAO90226.1 methyltransferase [Coxiella burnetii RSA 493]ABX78990.1 putative methyltransferase [Coxiella burnetii RSA 331]ACJ18632.1 methyltransferase [Coxiella burnetii CbuG_Q212]ACJ20729.1 methyltransferase [Coxiella burnetii CbuK_Q154]AIT63805.1 Putative methyltransferase [Coxiella burnetii str. Namibia]